MVFIMIRLFEQVPCLTVTGTCTMSHWHYDADSDICRKWRPTGGNLAPFTKLLKPRWRDRRHLQARKTGSSGDASGRWEWRRGRGRGQKDDRWLSGDGYWCVGGGVSWPVQAGEYVA